MKNLDFGARKFNQKSYNENDNFAKDKFINFIKKRWHKIINSNEEFSHDIITEKKGVLFFFEVEVKRNYPFTTRDTYIFDTVSFLGRKKKLHYKNPFYYIIICKETEWAVCCESKKIFIDNYIENLNINTSDRNGKDQMFRVPKEKCLFFDINL